MKIKHKIYIALAASILMLTGTSLYAQGLDEVLAHFRKYTQIVVQEKLYVNTDRTTYMAGELLWFKVYDINAADNKLMDAGKVVYTEILDKDNNPILQGKTAMKASTGDGSFYIPVSVTTGTYKLRAYTNWMKNFSADKYFEKAITIINPLKQLTFQTAVAAPAHDIQFFPEGGNLVNGLTSKVAYRVVGSDGKGVDFYGAIINRNNDTVARFKPHHFGMGTFMLKPDAINGYRAVLKFAGNKTETAALPTIAPNGYALLVADEGAQLKITVSGTHTGQVYLIAHTRNTIDEAKSIDLNSGQGIVTIDKSKLGEGISYITLFNSERQPVCERLYMKRPTGEKLELSAIASAPEYVSRKKVDVSVAVKNDVSPANISVAVYRVDSLQSADPESIYTNLWLTSELRGNVESPEYYLNGNDDEALDNLMLVHGWSKFNWDEMSPSSVAGFKYLPEYDGHIVTGKLFDPKTQTGVANKRVLLTVPGRRVQLYNAVTGNDGNFFMLTRDFVGTNEIVVQPRLEQDTLLKAQINTSFSDHYSANKLSEFNLPKESYSALSIHNLSMQIQNLYSIEKVRREYMPAIDTTAVFSGLQKEYLLDNYVRFTTMEEVLREITREVIVGKVKDQFRFRILNNDYYMESNQPLMLYDGIPVYNQNKIIAADPLKVRKVDVIPAIYYLGTEKEYGLLSFTTFKGDLGGVEIDPHALVMDYEGMQLKRSFFSPVYETESQISSHLPDARTLLYWSPDITTDASGKANFGFYTSDQSGKYIGVIQGISTSGKAGMQTFNFEVKDRANP